MNGLRTRFLIRALVGAALGLALLACALAPVPRDLPSLALQQPGLYRLEVGLLVFYGSLLIITPSVSGLLWGRLPTEISIRGASFAEETDQLAALDEAAVKRLEQDSARLDDKLTQAKHEIDELKRRGDST